MMKQLNEYFGIIDEEYKKQSPHCSILQCTECP